MSTPSGLLTALILLTLTSITAQAQSERFPFGRVTAEDFTVRESPIDENANVLILMSYGEVHFNIDAELVYIVHARFRILNDKGLVEADQQYGFNPKTSSSIRQEVDGYTHTMGADGRIKRTRIGRNGIFFETVTDEYTRVKFTFPDVAVGSILEYRYTIRYKNYFLFPTWYFQDSYPTLHSEFLAFIPNSLSYVVVNNGYVTMEPRDQELYRESERPRLYMPLEGGTKSHFIALNVPALVEESFITTLGDYRAAIQFQLKGTNFSNGNNKTYMATWESLTDELLRHSGFGQKITTGGEMREELALIGIPDSMSAIQKARAIYAHVTKRYEVTGPYGYFPDKSTPDLFRTKTGNNTTVAFGLLNLLKQAGLDAHPVLISTRDHRRVFWDYPLVTQFNHVLVHLTIGSQSWLLDPVSQDIPFGMLSPRSLNKEGFMVKPPGVIRVPLNPKQKSRLDVTSNLILNPDGSAAIDFDIRASAHAGILARESIRKTSEEAHMRDLVKFIPLVEQLETTLLNFDDPEQPLTLQGILVSTQILEPIGELMLLRPSILYRWDENPFKNPSRAYPVDFGVEMEVNMTVNIRLPDGFAVESLPPTKQSRLGQDGLFQSRFVAQDSTVFAMYNFRINRSEFTRRQYTDLRQFFSEMVDVHSQPIVLRRNEP